MSPIRSRFRRIFGRLLLLAIPLVLAFGAAELVLWMAGRPESPPGEPAAKDPRWLTVDPSAELGWIFPADTTGTYKSSGRNTPVTTNSWGLRGGEVSADTAAFRILVLGDSFAFGWGMAPEDGFVRLLETGVQNRYPDRLVEFINGSLPGYSIFQQIRMLDYVRQRTDIHAVVATISLANDPIDEKRIRRFAPDNLLDFSYEWRDPRSFSAKLIAASRLLTLIDGRTTTFQFSYINTNNECRDLASESMMNLATACREANLPLVWVLVSRTQEVRPGGFLRRSLNGATDRMRRHFMALAKELEVPIVDLKPVLVDVQAREEAYLPGDAHWTEAGHRAVAESVLPVLLELCP